jgi:hypothetical protein
MRYMRVVAATMLAAVLTIGAAGCKDAMAPSVLANMGGMDGVAKFLDNWTSTVAADANLSKTVTADDMGMIAQGFKTEIAKASEVPLPSAGVDLVQVLTDKKYPKESLTGLRGALQTATVTSKLSPDATKGALGLWDQTVKKLK